MTGLFGALALDRSLTSLLARWRDLSSAAGFLAQAPSTPDLAPGDLDMLAGAMRESLEARGGEVSARARAAALGQVYLKLSTLGRCRFLGLLARDFGADPRALSDAARRYLEAASTEQRAEAERALREAAEAPRVRLLTRFTSLPAGVKFLVDMRTDLLAMQGDDPVLRALDWDLRHLLATWFDVGFLELRRITWDSPASLLERLVTYEAVHEVRSWSDLKNRLDADRRVYAFFHPRMPGEPLIFVQVAFTRGIADNVQTLLDETAPVLDPRAADTAIFYSITNTQEGLRGISFGNFLIKRVVDDLGAEFPGIEVFSTLSPVPGFLRWLRRLDQGAVAQAAGLVEEDAEALAPLLAVPDWQQDPQLAEALREPLLRLCARYIAGPGAETGKEVQASAFDPVARFHLGNGARVERLNWLGDTSPKGMRQSAAIMVNYRYESGEIERNHERFAATHAVALSPAVEKLLRPVRRRRPAGLARLLQQRQPDPQPDPTAHESV
ncbi:malonyl-CoA decarboxylase [Arenibaculum pallidiluteum]|uniref:malonyl-CoA decarboxylase n=1 Tax=Arenibaculum pallidiluteum TaxID=2812559 RepID=UPI001A962BCC|nr:malonyl-CoA decarboxylase [Arenibaculum pallidiluteum]